MEKDGFYSLDLIGAILKPTKESRWPWESMLLNMMTFISSQGTRLACKSYPTVVKRFFISTDMAYRFQKSFTLTGGNFFQTLEPRVKYFRRSGSNSDSTLSLDTALLPLTIESLWRDDELVGRDRRESTDWLALGFSSRVHSLQTGKEKIEFSVGVKERFRREETESQMSTVPLNYWTKRLYGSSLRWNFGNNTGFEVTRMSGGEHESVSQTHFGLEHRNGQAGLFSLAYRKGNRLSGFLP